MALEPTDSGIIRSFFVDEAGDLTLFDRKGRVIVGAAGVSRYFMLGVCELPSPDNAAKVLDELRSDLINDPYFRGVPSMRPEAGRTAVAFHAKDDPQEVRREVFRVLPTLEAKVQVIIRRKANLASVAQQALLQSGMRLTPNHVYDDLVKRLFRNLLHKADENRVVFARRGKAPRQRALEEAIEASRRNFRRKWAIASNASVRIGTATPAQSAGLQVVDYYLWALQRMLERREDRFFELLRPAYRLIVDLDDTRRRPYGEYYQQRHPLTLEKIKPSTD